MPSIFDRVRSGFGLFDRAPKKASGALAGRVLPDQSLWAQFQRVGGSLTPQRVSEIIRMADTGYMWPLMDLANEFRQKDTHLQATLETSEQAIAELEWELVPPDKPKAKELRAKEWVEEIVRNHPQLPKLIGHQVGARYFGYAVTEKSFVRDDARLVPGELTFHPPRRFGFDQQTGKFIWRDWNMPSVGVDFLAEFPNRFIVSRPRVTGDVPVREGLVRVLMWAALFRNWTLSDWLKLGEIAWKPWRTGTYKKGTEDKDIDNLVAILEGLTSSGVAMLPEGTELKIEWPTGGKEKAGHQVLYVVMAGEISKVVLGQTLTTEVGSTGGNRALGEVHESKEEKKRNATARWVAADLQRDFVEPLFALNYGGDIRPSRFRFLIEEDEDLVSFADGIGKLKLAGLRIPAQWVRDQVGIPEPEDDEECLGDGQEEIDPETGKPIVDPNDPNADPNAEGADTKKPAADGGEGDGGSKKPPQKE